MRRSRAVRTPTRAATINTRPTRRRSWKAARASRSGRPTGVSFLDYGMALRAVSIGYAEPAINAAAIRGLEPGNSLTRASMIELEAAERLVVAGRFGGHGEVHQERFDRDLGRGQAGARLHGPDLVARCAQHPFFSFDDWFIGSTPITKGIPTEHDRADEDLRLQRHRLARGARRRVSGPVRVRDPGAGRRPARPATASTAPHRQERNYLQQVRGACAASTASSSSWTRRSPAFAGT